MFTMTSLEAQNQFGYLIDTSQREPVTITRRGRPVAVVQAFQDAQSIPFHIARLIAKTYPLRGHAAADALARASANMGNAAELDGLTEQGVAQIISEARP
jgi:prevent-host-death family protein